MQWLQATFASRFNRHRNEHGHLFQGRYRALVIGGEDMLSMVCDYIHLNPAAAKFRGIADLASYRYSSYWYLRSAARRPGRLRVESALAVAGGLTDDAPGWARYDEHLSEVLADQAKNKRRDVQLSRGWAIGSDALKAALIAQHAPAGLARAWTVPGALQMREAQWEEYLGKILARLGRTADEARRAPKSETWKLAIASWMRDSVRARNNWLSSKLGLGAPAVVRRNLARYRCRHQAGDSTWEALRSSFST